MHISIANWHNSIQNKRPRTGWARRRRIPTASSPPPVSCSSSKAKQPKYEGKKGQHEKKGSCNKKDTGVRPRILPQGMQSATTRTPQESTKKKPLIIFYWVVDVIHRRSQLLIKMRYFTCGMYTTFLLLTKCREVLIYITDIIRIKFDGYLYGNRLENKRNKKSRVRLNYSKAALRFQSFKCLKVLRWCKFRIMRTITCTWWCLGRWTTFAVFNVALIEVNYCAINTFQLKGVYCDESLA